MPFGDFSVCFDAESDPITYIFLKQTLSYKYKIKEFLTKSCFFKAAEWRN